ncbi:MULTISPECIES: hypothetical protein [unclassified Mycobacterium]|uniref:hypothetical protein n=1 Tax=unclassified Mycobacterium TaxID=2642494 RepID=UPI0012E3C471|nr:MULTISPECIES: hypothetical protein [unclassified Mycobacterium]
MSDRPIPLVAATVALAAGAALFAAPEADARPPRTTEDQLAQNCTSSDGIFERAQGQFKPRDRYYSCKYTLDDGSQSQHWFSSAGQPTQVCYRFSIDTAWVCH